MISSNFFKVSSCNLILNKYLLSSVFFIFSCNYLFASDIELNRAIAQSLADSMEELKINEETENATLESILLASLEEQEGEKEESETKSDFTILKARTKGDVKHLWDCSWEILNNASFIYKTLKNNNVINKDISNIPYGSWCPESSQYDKLNITFNDMQNVIQNNKLLDNNSYTSIEGDINTLSSLDIDTLKQIINFNVDNIKQLQKPKAIFVFFINSGAHWFTIIAHNKNGKIHYYIADDTPSKTDSLYKNTIKLLKRLIY